MHKLSTQDRVRIASELRQHLATCRLSQQEYAATCGIDQSQLSRFIQGRFTRLSKNLQSVCKYAHINTSPALKADPRKSKLLMEALEQLWNGEPEHARAIARLLLAAKSLGSFETM